MANSFDTAVSSSADISADCQNASNFALNTSAVTLALQHTREAKRLGPGRVAIVKACEAAEANSNARRLFVLNHYQARGLIGAPNRLYSVPIDASEPVELLILRRGGCVNQSTIE